MKVQSLVEKYIGRDDIKEISTLISESNNRAFALKGLLGSSKAFAAGALFNLLKRSFLFVMNDKESAAYFYNDLEVILNEVGGKAEEKRVFFFPSSFKRNIRHDNVDGVNILSRTELLNIISSRRKRNYIIVSYPEAIFEKLINQKDYQKSILSLKLGQVLNIEPFIEKLTDNHFVRVDFTVEPGQFSIRGGIIDVFSYAHEHPFRIELSGDDIESLRSFDVISQTSIEKHNRIEIAPNILKTSESVPQNCIIEYLSDTSVLGFESAAFLWDNINHLWEETPFDLAEIEEGVSKQDRFLSPEELSFLVNKHSLIDFGAAHFFKEAAIYNFKTSHQAVFNKNFELLIEHLKHNTKNQISNCIFSTLESQIKRLDNIFEDIAQEAISSGALHYKLVQSSIHQGFIDHDTQIACYTDHQIFERYHRFRIRDGYKSKQAFTLKELNNLMPGDYVTHIDHGIGRFDGLEKIEVNGKEQEALRIVYKDNDLLYLSIHSLHRITKYSGKEGAEPKLHKIGSPAWQTLKNKTKARVKDIAKDLIKLYAQRKASKGYAFMPDTYLQHELEASFLYEDTPDQEKATADVKKDMEAAHPMDRLICGDVGFGKTEIAIRAAFKAVSDSKQVAVLVPTTILALQHYNTFKDRLKNFPCNIDYISRLKTTKSIKESLEKLKSGETDIIIGTHRIVSKDVGYKDLGLLIVDEEQKFGVSVKEKLKKIKVNVDTLTLTATPIPRTLQFSLMGARDLSIINTPPANRYPIITELISFNEELIKESIAYEISRGGQVFFVNNRIENIYELSDTLKRWMPQLKIAIGHGQMQGRQLEQVMIDFTEGHYDLLLATTIIESGLDIANVNTIIINNAHNFGLSELHQLRGRVGRTNKKAFCYLICPPLSALTPDAQRRLKAIEEFSDLGSGLNIAMRDLDIRGSGNLLGGEQSGFISEIGFEMYHRILDEAMTEIKEKDAPQTTATNTGEDIENFVKECNFESDLEILIPNAYIQNIAERLLVYKEINDLKTNKALETYIKILKDRFGEPPPQTMALFNVVRLRWAGKKAGFEKIVLKNNTLNCYFIQDHESPYFGSKNFIRILDFVKNNPKNCAMRESNHKLALLFKDVKSLDDALKLIYTIVT